MKRKIRKIIKLKWWKSANREIDPDEIFLDSSNLPQFDTSQFEGRIEKPISKRSLIFLAMVFLFAGCLYVSKVWALQVTNGALYTDKSENNRLKHTLIFAQRGIIYDRNNVELAWNIPGDDPDFTLRKYLDEPGLGHVLGYVKYPSKDKYGFYYREDFTGMDGVEKFFNDDLQGTNGLKIIEVNALEKVQSQSVVQPPKEGKNLVLSIDSRIQTELGRYLADVCENVGFAGGAAVMMNIQNGEVIALTNYPEYNSEILSQGSDSATINKYLTDKRKPFLDRAINGLYAPGSTFKTIIAMGALSEHTVDPLKKILSTGSISIPNPYDPTKETIFRDWQPQGWVDMRKAIAMSSDVYFYEVGGGYKDQKGLGITNIDKYARLFGLGASIPSPFFSSSPGVIPTPEWKKQNFNGEAWTLGDTYHTSIGQYGVQVTPMQMVREIGAIATDGNLIIPTILKDDKTHTPLERKIDLPVQNFDIVKEGMRMTVTDGTAKNLNFPFVQVAAKTGSAELGVSKETVNSWIVGFFPYDHPKYAFAVALENGSRHNLVGGSVVMSKLFTWMSSSTPEYFQ